MKFRTFTLCVFSVFALGCERLPEGFPKLYPTTITITQEGEPLDEADVHLYRPDDPDFRWIIAGRTDSSGTARLYTLVPPELRKNGAPEGKFKVTVSKTTFDAVPSAPNPVDPPEVHRAYIEQIRTIDPHTHYFVEEEYSNLHTTQLEITVERKRNSFTLDVGNKIHRKVPRQL